MSKLIIISILLFSLNSFAGQKVDYEVNGITYEGYFEEAKEASPLIILIHDWDGLTEYEIERSKMLKDLGYSVFAVDLFGKGVRPTEVPDKKAKTGALYKNRKLMGSIMKAAISKAKSLSPKSEKIVSVGYCFGGAVVLELARNEYEMEAFFSFHGSYKTPEGQDYKSTKGDIVVYHGSADKIATLEQLAVFAKELEEHKITHEMVIYSGARHAFSVLGSPRYNKSADEKSWKHFTNYLQELF
jgi:dienelactone hydrolase